MKSIKVENRLQHGKFVNLPVDGKVEVSADGIIEVSDECASAIEGIKGYSLASKQLSEDKAIEGTGETEKVAEKQAEVSKTAKEDEPKAAAPKKKAKKPAKKTAKAETAEEKKDRLAEIRKGLIKTSTGDLQKMCSEAGLPEEEWGGIKNKLSLVKYVMDNIDQA